MIENTRNSPYFDVPAVPEDEFALASLLDEGFEELELEIGFGKGHFLLGRAMGNSRSGVVGIETKRKLVHYVGGRIDKRALKNARVYHGDARAAMKRLGPQASVSRIFINFPDPWWKAKHQKRMVVAEETVQEAARLLVDGGELFVQTDVDFRAEAYLQVLSSASDIEPIKGDGTIESNPFAARSLRETQCEKIGLPIYRMLFQRKTR